MYILSPHSRLVDNMDLMLSQVALGVLHGNPTLRKKSRTDMLLPCFWQLDGNGEVC